MSIPKDDITVARVLLARMQYGVRISQLDNLIASVSDFWQADPDYTYLQKITKVMYDPDGVPRDVARFNVAGTEYVEKDSAYDADIAQGSFWYDASQGVLRARGHAVAFDSFFQYNSDLDNYREWNDEAASAIPSDIPIKGHLADDGSGSMSFFGMEFSRFNYIRIEFDPEHIPNRETDGSLVEDGTRKWEYWNGTEWTDLTVTHVVGNVNWDDAGGIVIAVFDPPDDWARDDGPGDKDTGNPMRYWVRSRCIGLTGYADLQGRASRIMTQAVLSENISVAWCYYGIGNTIKNLEDDTMYLAYVPSGSEAFTSVLEMNDNVLPVYGANVPTFGGTLEVGNGDGQMDRSLKSQTFNGQRTDYEWRGGWVDLYTVNEVTKEERKVYVPSTINLDYKHQTSGSLLTRKMIIPAGRYTKKEIAQRLHSQWNAQTNIDFSASLGTVEYDTASDRLVFTASFPITVFSILSNSGSYQSAGTGASATIGFTTAVDHTGALAYTTELSMSLTPVRSGEEPFSAYTQIGRVMIEGVGFSDFSITLRFMNLMKGLDLIKWVPVFVNQKPYSHMDTAFVGKPIPAYWGDVNDLFDLEDNKETRWGSMLLGVRTKIGEEDESVIGAPTHAPTLNSITTTTPSKIQGGTYRYRVTYSTGSYETQLSTATLVVKVNNTSPVIDISTVHLENVPVSGAAEVTDRRVYRSKRNTNGPFYFVGNLSDNVTTIFDDDKNDGDLPADPYKYDDKTKPPKANPGMFGAQRYKFCATMNNPETGFSHGCSVTSVWIKHESLIPASATNDNNYEVVENGTAVHFDDNFWIEDGKVEISAIMQGFLDDDLGTFTGTPFALINQVQDIIHFLWVCAAKQPTSLLDLSKMALVGQTKQDVAGTISIDVAYFDNSSVYVNKELTIIDVINRLCLQYLCVFQPGVDGRFGIYPISSTLENDDVAFFTEDMAGFNEEVSLDFVISEMFLGIRQLPKSDSFKLLKAELGTATPYPTLYKGFVIDKPSMTFGWPAKRIEALTYMVTESAGQSLAKRIYDWLKRGLVKTQVDINVAAGMEQLLGERSLVTRVRGIGGAVNERPMFVVRVEKNTAVGKASMVMVEAKDL